MRRHMIRSCMVGMLALMVAMPSSAETTRTETADYVGTSLFSAPTGCFYGLGDDPDIGGACFFVDGESTLTVTIDDVSPLPAGGDLTFLSGSEVVQSVLFCGEIIDHPIPDGASRLIVSVDTGTGAVSCLGRGGPSVAGTITATFVSA